VESVINGFAKQALRVICLGYRDFATEQDWENEEALLEDLIISAFVGIQDPVRDEVPEAVKTCQHAGVIVRMLTGDNMLTARAIALNCGILTEGDGMLVMEVRTHNPVVIVMIALMIFWYCPVCNGSFECY
jgi:Ca2+ transporting ATPase